LTDREPFLAVMRYDVVDRVPNWEAGAQGGDEPGGMSIDTPTVDHTVPPDVSLDNFCYYMRRKADLLAGRL
jgi:hypothetical protein